VRVYLCKHACAVESSVVALRGATSLNRFVLKNPEMGLRIVEPLAERRGSTSERMAVVANKEVLSRLASQIRRLVQNEKVVDREGATGCP
jgi:CRP-like cAMP-binding protein